jgi:hypothetical protein
VRAQAESKAQAEAKLRVEAEENAALQFRAKEQAEAKAQNEVELRLAAEQRADSEAQARLEAEAKLNEVLEGMVRTGTCECCGRNDVLEKDLAIIDSGQLLCSDCIRMLRG